MGLFKKKTLKEKLEKKYRQLLKEAHEMSSINRSKSDALLAEADAVLKQIENEA